jgi:ketosteroid isomerase-like protein
VDREQKPGKSSGTTDFEKPAPGSAAHNAALAEIFQRLYPEIKRPKPSQQAIAEALHAMQRLTIESDSEAVAEKSVPESDLNDQIACHDCGHQNRQGNKFCGACGALIGAAPAGEETQSFATAPAPRSAYSIPEEATVPQTPPPAPELTPEAHPAPSAPAGTHYYHHHYHHHYFDGTPDAAAATPRVNASDSAREADRLRLAAAAKGENMSRSEAAVRRLTQEWVLACNTRQLDELIELYAGDALVLRPNLPPIRGAIAVREFFFASLEAGLGEVALDPLRVEISGDLAHEVGRYSALVPGTAGKRREERGKYLWVFAKQTSGDWKLISECWASDLMLNAESDAPKAVISAAKGQPRKA